MIRGVLFDLDGTLADSLDDIAGSMNRVLAALGHAGHPVASYKQFVGEGVEQLARAVLPAGADAETQRRCIEAYRAEYAVHSMDATRAYPGIAALCSALARRGLSLGVVTNKPETATYSVLEGILPEVRFGAIVGARADRPRKPDPAGALEAARNLGLEPGVCAFVGDTRTDMETARSAGMRAIGVLGGFRDRAELEAHGAQVICATPAEVLEALDAL